MDILAARKKAAERAKAQQQQEPEPERTPEVKQARAEEPTPPAAAAHMVIAAEPPALGAVVSAAEVPADTGGASPGDGLEEVQAEEIELLSFRLGGEEYAVMINDVREVLKNYLLTVVPNAPDYILGVMSLRGTVTTIIDPCRRIGLTPGVRDDKSRIIIVSTADEDMGLLVDRVTGVVRISPNDIRPAPENNEQGAEFLQGIARKNDKLHILLDLAKVTGA